LNELQIDAIREMGSIGVGHAATALSQLVGHPVSIEVPTAALIPVTEVPMTFGGPEALAGAVFCRLLGDVDGSIMFVAPRNGILGLADMLRAREPGSAKSIGAEEEALATHCASVLITSYLAAISRLTELSVLPSQPQFALDMLGAVLDAVTAELGLRTDVAVLVLTKFATEEVSVDAALFFLPDPESLDVLLGRLGVV
jgi:chemotaxis protein CheC